MRSSRTIGLILALSVLTYGATAQAAGAPNPEQIAVDPTPPRLSLAEGQVSFWRPGAQDWAQAQVNTPLAAGDELWTGSPGTVELQIGTRGFVRGWANTQVGLESQEQAFLQVKVTAGTASFDLRTLEAGQTVEVNTPNAAVTIEHAGYYRIDVTGERTTFITRRAGQATVIPANGEAVAITPSEEVVIEGTSSPHVTAYAAPPLDDWDTWNYARTSHLLDAVSARYVSPGTYGASDLDFNGTWRIVPTYGPVWVPTAVQTGWVPYSTGSWVLDPLYGWTWVDTAPWGWAPYHYGRWVFVDGFWAWAPGPVVARPVYAPALVAFFGGPVVAWVALGWGEPVVPWWGREGVGVPTWRGWGGPRVVNNVVINTTTVVNVQNINVYRNTGAPNAVVAVNKNRFGQGSIASARVAQVDVQSLRLTHTAPQVVATSASFAPTASRGVRPPEVTLKQPVVVTRPPQSGAETAAGGARKVGPPGVPAPAPRHVLTLQPRATAPVSSRPPFGQSTVERPMVDRTQLPSPPEAPVTRRVPPPMRTPQVATPAPTTPSPPPGRPATPPLPARRPEVATPLARPLPGVSANRLSPHRLETTLPRRVERQASPPPARPHGAPENGPRTRPGD